MMRAEECKESQKRKKKGHKLVEWRRKIFKASFSSICQCTHTQNIRFLKIETLYPPNAFVLSLSLYLSTLYLSLCLTGSGKNKREKSDFHITDCYDCHYIPWFTQSQRGEADKCIFTVYIPTHTHTQSNNTSKLNFFHRDTLQEKSKQARCLPSDPLLNLLPLTHLVEMESYLAKTAAGALAWNILHSYTNQILLFANRFAWDRNTKVVCFVLRLFFSWGLHGWVLEKQCIRVRS